MHARASLTDSFAFLLGKLGQLATERFAAGLEPLGLRPRHCGLLELLAQAPRSQLALSEALRITPSVVVDMVDELEAMKVAKRTRDTEDRRKQLVTLTAKGDALRKRVLRLAKRVDAGLLTTLDEPAQKHTRESLKKIYASATLLHRP